MQNINPSNPINQKCIVPGHDSKPIKYICFQKDCKENRLLCFSCLTLSHKICSNAVVEIESLFERDLPTNSGLISCPDVKQAALFLKREGATTKGKDSFNQKIEGMLDQEIDKLVHFFSQRLIQIKNQFMSNLKESELTVNSDEFLQKLNNIFNFDSLLGIIQESQSDEKALQTISKRLDEYIKEMTQKQKEEENELKKMSRAFCFYDQCHSKIKTELFDQFKESIPFNTIQMSLNHIVHEYGVKSLRWDLSKKSQSIEVSEDGKDITKIKGSKDGLSTAIGNLELNEGRYQWTLKINTNRSDNRWILFGIVETNLINDFESLEYAKFIGFSTTNKYHGMTEVNKMQVTTNNTYLCEFDWQSNVFNITHEGRIICKSNQDLKGRTFVPFVVLEYEDNEAVLC